MEVGQSVLSVLAQFGVFFIGAFISIKTGEIAPSVILLFVQLMNYILNPLMQIPSVLSKRLACKPLFKKIEELILKEEETEEKQSIEKIDEILVSNLKFMYDDKIVLVLVVLEKQHLLICYYVKNIIMKEIFIITTLKQKIFL